MSGITRRDAMLGSMAVAATVISLPYIPSEEEIERAKFTAILDDLDASGRYPLIAERRGEWLEKHMDSWRSRHITAAREAEWYKSVWDGFALGMET